MAKLTLRIEYVLADHPDQPIAIAMVKTIDDGTEERMVAHFSPELAIHYGELLADLGRRATDHQQPLDKEDER
jgi:hypothetical protein